MGIGGHLAATLRTIHFERFWFKRFFKDLISYIKIIKIIFSFVTFNNLSCCQPFLEISIYIHMITAAPTECKRYLYGLADEKFVKIEPRKPKEDPLSSFKFRLNPQVQGKADVKEFDRKDVPIVFKCSPDKLLNLCVRILDVFPLPEVYKWSIEEICKWLRESGFKQYQNTFRANLITGRTLLLLDASNLVAMNIRDFDHITKITRGIRALFYYEMTNFGRCLSLYPEFHQELYKLVRLKTGAKYDVQRSTVWRKMQLIRQKEPNYTHWEILEQWLGDNKQPQHKELIAGIQRSMISSRQVDLIKPATGEKPCAHCPCMPPCECFSNELDGRPPWHLKCLLHLKPDKEFVAACTSCAPICNCHWSYKKYHIRGVLTYLKESLPNKYGRHSSRVRYRRSEQKTRFSHIPQT